ncbi:MAG: sporulation integral membrane protein YtvI [Firmicutes bacterium]|nr:sporulation integral membrane protein YtvI [Bacillota bacterium]
MQVDARLRTYLRKVSEVAVLVSFLVILAVLFARVYLYVLPFILGFLLAVSLWPIVRQLERTGTSRRLSIVLTLVVVLGGILALLGLLIVQGTEEAISLSQVLPHFFGYWRDYSETVLQQGMTAYAHLPAKLVTAIQSTTTSILDQARQIALGLLTGVFADVAVLPDVILVIVISVIAAYFFMAEKEYMLTRLRGLLPPGWAPKLESVASDVGRALAGLLRAQLVLIAVTCLIGVVGLTIMGMPYALILGVAFGVTGWVPIVGSGIVTLPWAIGAFSMGHYVIAIKILLLQAVASLVRHSIEPKLLASNMGIGTFATLFGMYVGLTSIGFVGLLLGPICVIALRSLLRARMFGDFFREGGGGAYDGAGLDDHQPKI